MATWGLKSSGKTLYIPSASSGGGGGGGGHGLLDVLKAPVGFTQNLLQDVGQAAAGLGPGLFMLGKAAAHDLKHNVSLIDMMQGEGETAPIAKEMAKAEWETWSPLFTGHPKEFAKGVYEHPLAPILDVAAFFTGGSTLAAKAGAKAAEGSMLARVAKYSEGGSIRLSDRPGASGRLKTMEDTPGGNIARPDLLKPTKTNPASRYRQEKFHQLSEHLASKGGIYARPAQKSYERAALYKLAGNAGAIEWQYARLSSALDEIKKAETNPQHRATLIRNMFADNWQNVVNHAEASNQLIPVEQVVTQGYNKVAHTLLRKKNLVLARGKKTKKSVAQGSDEKILRNFETFGKRLQTNSLKDAHIVDVDGVPHVVLVNRQTARNLGIEAANTSNMVLNLYHNATAIWKVALLGFSPRFLVNNAVGNSFMYAIENAGAGAIPGLYQGMKQVNGVQKADKWLEDALKDVNAYKSDGWVNMYHSDAMAQSFHHTAIPSHEAGSRARREIMGEAEQPFTKTEKVAKKGLFQVAGKHAERNLRIAMLYTKASREPLIRKEVERLRKWNQGKSDAERFDLAVKNVYKKHPEVYRRVSSETETTMGNYIALTGPERKLRTVDPFYTWQRHILKNSANMALNRPGRTRVLAEIGNMGSEHAQEAIGEHAPEWMRGFVPFGGADRLMALSTQGMNPYASVGELAAGLESILPGTEGAPTIGATLGSQLNPFVQSGIETLGGTRMLTGQPKSSEAHGPLESLIQGLGPVGSFLGTPIQNLPQVQLGQSIVAPNKYKEETLYSKSPLEYFASLMGVPVKWIDQGRANEMGKSEETRRGGKLDTKW